MIFDPNTTYEYDNKKKENKNKNAAADRIALNTTFKSGLGKTTRICLDNRGQITHYPYILDEPGYGKTGCCGNTSAVASAGYG